MNKKEFLQYEKTMGKIAYCFGKCQAFRTNMQGLDKCPICESEELIFSE